jgi:Protein kinase G tetratricopeptide repeat
VLEAALASVRRPRGQRARGPANGSAPGAPPGGGANGANGSAGRPGQILGLELSERQLRIGLERAYRALAHLSQDTGDRIALVDRANSVRPRTLL